MWTPTDTHTTYHQGFGFIIFLQNAANKLQFAITTVITLLPSKTGVTEHPEHVFKVVSFSLIFRTLSVPVPAGPEVVPSAVGLTHSPMNTVFIPNPRMVIVNVIRPSLVKFTWNADKNCSTVLFRTTTYSDIYIHSGDSV